jgi:hypothetical protein
LPRTPKSPKQPKKKIIKKKKKKTNPTNPKEKKTQTKAPEIERKPKEEHQVRPNSQVPKDTNQNPDEEVEK